MDDQLLWIAMGPDWSPDGKSIVFSMFTERTNSTDLYVVAPDGTGLAKVTSLPGAEQFPRWDRSATPRVP